VTGRFEKARVSHRTNRVLEPWRYLALSVIQMAFVDRDLDWLLGNSVAFRFWCDVAGLEPGAIRRAAKDRARRE